MNEEELKKEIELVNVWFNDNWDNVKIFENMIKKANDLFSNKNTLESYREYLNAKLEGFQKGKLEQKKEGLIIMNGSNVDLRICETEAISEDEDEINQIGVIKSGCGLRVYPKYNSIYIEQLQKEIEEEKQDE